MKTKLIITILSVLIITIACGKDSAVESVTSIPTAPAVTYYINNGDGTFTEKSSGLMWTKYPTIDTTYTWADAMTYAANSTHAGYTDWRLPTPSELVNQSLSGADESAHWLQAEGFIIYNVGMYWTNAQFDSSNAYAVQLGRRDVTQPTIWAKTPTKFYVWIVR